MITRTNHLPSEDLAQVTLITPRYTLNAELERVMPTADFIRGAKARLARQNVCLRVLHEEEISQGALERLSPDEKRFIVGITVSELSMAPLRALAAAGSKIALIGQGASHCSWALTIDTDGRAGIRQAVEHVRRFGHQRIVLLSYESDSSSMLWWVREREESYKEFMVEAGLTPVVKRLPADLHLEEYVAVGVAEIEKWLPAAVRGEVGMTALICVHDPLAQLVMEVCRRHAIGVPGDLSLVGYDDIPWAVGQGLTTLQLPYREAGEWVADIVMRVMRQPQYSWLGPLYIAPRLVSRESVGLG